MTNQKMLTRDIIIQTLINALEPIDYVHAFWEGGAVAFDRIDEWSDLDLYFAVDDTKVDKTFVAVEMALNSLSPIKQKYEVPQLPWPGLSQAFFRLENASEYLLIDLVVMKISSPEKLLQPEIHGNAVFYFNKSNKIKAPPLDKDAFIKKLQKRLERLQARFDMFNNFVQKEINRGNHLEAMYNYFVTLDTLVEALRIRHNPVHHNFKMHYIKYELPSESIKKLRHLYFVKDERDLQEKYHRAVKWFHEITSEIDQKGIERPVRTS